MRRIIFHVDVNSAFLSWEAVYRLRLYGERTFPEIAAALGQPEAAVKTRYYRLMARLRKEFG